MRFTKITCMVIAVCVVMILAGTVLAAEQEQQKQLPNVNPRFTVLRSGSHTSALAMDSKYHSVTGNAGIHAPVVQMPFWVGSNVMPFSLYNANNVRFYYDMIGTDPRRGAVSTTIPVRIIPVIFTWGRQGTADPTKPACGDTVSVIGRTTGSPLFSPYSGTYPVSGGTGQYIDAFQKNNFDAWGGNAAGYHVLLSQTVDSNPLVIDGTTAGSVLETNSCGGPIGGFDIGTFDGIIQADYMARGIPKNVLPLYVSYDTFLTSGGCCILGYHGTDANDQTYSFAAYNDPGIFRAPIQDIHAMSHELGEWMDDPFGINPTPPWGHVGQVSGCQNNLEVGDPVTGTPFFVTQNGFTYTPEDLVYHGWFMRQNPSGSVHGLFTFLGTFTHDAGPLCQ